MGSSPLKPAGVYCFMYMKCEGCGAETDYLEKHHIVPKSRGGSDSDSNISHLCVKCHSKAHDVAFSKNDSGLVKEGLNNWKKAQEDAIEWLNDSQNEDKVHDMIMDVQYHDAFLGELIVSLLENNKIKAIHLKEWHDTGALWYGGRTRKKWVIREKGIYVD